MHGLVVSTATNKKKQNGGSWLARPSTQCLLTWVLISICGVTLFVLLSVGGMDSSSRMQKRSRQRTTEVVSEGKDRIKPGGKPVDDVKRHFYPAHRPKHHLEKQDDQLAVRDDTDGGLINKELDTIVKGDKLGGKLQDIEDEFPNRPGGFGRRANKFGANSNNKDSIESENNDKKNNKGDTGKLENNKGLENGVIGDSKTENKEIFGGNIYNPGKSSSGNKNDPDSGNNKAGLKDKSYYDDDKTGVKPLEPPPIETDADKSKKPSSKDGAGGKMPARLKPTETGEEEPAEESPDAKVKDKKSYQDKEDYGEAGEASNVDKPGNDERKPKGSNNQDYDTKKDMNPSKIKKSYYVDQDYDAKKYGDQGKDKKTSKYQDYDAKKPTNQDIDSGKSHTQDKQAKESTDQQDKDYNKVPSEGKDLKRATDTGDLDAKITPFKEKVGEALTPKHNKEDGQVDGNKAGDGKETTTGLKTESKRSVGTGEGTAVADKKEGDSLSKTTKKMDSEQLGAGNVLPEVKDEKNKENKRAHKADSKPDEEKDYSPESKNQNEGKKHGKNKINAESPPAAAADKKTGTDGASDGKDKEGKTVADDAGDKEKKSAKSGAAGKYDAGDNNKEKEPKTDEKQAPVKESKSHFINKLFGFDRANKVTTTTTTSTTKKPSANKIQKE